MKTKNEIISSIDSVHEIADKDIRKTNTEFPTLLLVKEAVLHALNDTNSDNQLSDDIKSVIKSTNIEEILGVLKTPKQKSHFMSLFSNNIESGLLAEIGTTKKDSMHFYNASLESDDNKWLHHNWRANYLIGEELLISGKHQEALNYFLESLTDTNIPEPYKCEINFYIGKCYEELGDYKNAIEYYKEAIKYEGILEVYKCEINFHIGVCYEKLGDYKKVIEYYKEAIKYAKDKEIIQKLKTFLSFLFFRQRLYQEAIECVKELLLINIFGSLDVVTRSIVPMSLLRMGKYVEAIDEFKELLHHFPYENNAAMLIWDCYMWIGDCYLNLKQYMESLNYYKEALKGDLTEERFLNIISKVGESYEGLGDYIGALSFYKSMLDSEKYNPKQVNIIKQKMRTISKKLIK